MCSTSYFYIFMSPTCLYYIKGLFDLRLGNDVAVRGMDGEEVVARLSARKAGVAAVEDQGGHPFERRGPRITSSKAILKRDLNRGFNGNQGVLA